jgi:glycosyltransferase involved in cell wall biosynthesis
MRILVLIHEYPPIGGGGGHVAQDVARGLVKLGHEVHVLAPHMNGLAKHSSDEGVRLVRIPSFRRKAYVGDLLAMSGYLFVGFFAGLWLILKHRPHVIHVHFAVPAGALAWVLSKLTGVPYVLTSHLGDVPGGVPEKTDHWFRWVYPFTPRIWRDAAAVTAISDFTRHLALIHYPVEIKVIPNGIELVSGKTGQVEVNDPPQIIFAGRFVHQKEPGSVPQILHQVRDLDWHCVMIGDGEIREETMQQVTSLGLVDRFTFPGWLSHSEVNDIMIGSDILLLPSRTEGIPLTGLQALVNGLAIVASNVGGLSELVEPGKNGSLHEPEDVREFTSSLRKFLTNRRELAEAREMSRELSKKFDLELVVKTYEDVLKNAVDAR